VTPEKDFEKLEQALVRAGTTFSYPATPSLATRVREELGAERAKRQGWLSGWSTPPRLAYAVLAAVLLAFALLLAFPDARDALAQLLGLRTVRIILITPTPAPTATAKPTGTVTLLPTPLANTTSAVTPTVKPFTQCCETTLADARSRAHFKILLPPGVLPTTVFLQQVPNFGDAMQVILAFGDPGAPRFTLYEATNFLYGKLVSEGTVIEETAVKGERALWLSGAPHLLVYLNAQGEPDTSTQVPVNGNTLAWEAGNVTFRLETTLGREEAVRFAESLTEMTAEPIATLAAPPLPSGTPTPVAQCCEARLADARGRAQFRVRLPPDRLPSQVFFQDQILGAGTSGQQVILVFGDQRAPRFTLYEAQLVIYEKVIGMVGKGMWPGTILRETEVNGQEALWFSGTPHIVMYLDRNGQPVVGSERPVDANTLVWESGDVTIRLETTLSLEEAVAFAESLQ
jgi:hypothetical protein